MPARRRTIREAAAGAIPTFQDSARNQSEVRDDWRPLWPVKPPARIRAGSASLKRHGTDRKDRRW